MLVHTYYVKRNQAAQPIYLEAPWPLKLGWPLSNLFALRGSCIAKGTFGLAGGALDAAAQLHEAHGWASYIDSRGRWNKKASQGIAVGAGPPAFVACDVTAVKAHWLEFTA
ncbi:hypothetical protein MKX08_003589 [Trichoderma sp. CBMAI-0020]|nr:hypothetical protein MKX08_003589 [Trichoderma sp. CBMAI-0020]